MTTNDFEVHQNGGELLRRDEENNLDSAGDKVTFILKKSQLAVSPPPLI